MKLHGYFRSGAAYRVRIALNLKGLAYEPVFHHLRKGQQFEPEYLALNPQGLIPTLETGGAALTQSLAICEYLEEVYPDPPLLPSDPVQRAKVRAFALVIGADTHPLQNLRILKRLKELGHEQDEIDAWARRVIDDGLSACATLIANSPGPYCFGDQVTLADVFLIPQFGNARRVGVDLRWPRLLAVEAACLALPAFQAAAPENQPDRE